MSADNYYSIQNHPDGGFAAVMCFASEDYEMRATSKHLKFDTAADAIEFARYEPTEYNISIHPEVQL